MMNKNGEAVFNLSAALHNAIATKNVDLIKEIQPEFLKQVKVLKGLVYLNKGVGALTSQTLGARRIAGDLRDTVTEAKDFGRRSRGTENVNNINRDFIETMSNGVEILGTITKNCLVEQLGPKKFKIILTQGLNRQIRRMCESLGYRVRSLKRVRIMNIKLDVPTGKYRELTKEEVAELYVLLENSSKIYD